MLGIRIIKVLMRESRSHQGIRMALDRRITPKAATQWSSEAGLKRIKKGGGHFTLESSLFFLMAVNEKTPIQANETAQ